MPLSYSYNLLATTFNIGFSMKFGAKDDDIIEAAVFSIDNKWAKYGTQYSIMQWEEFFLWEN